MKTHPAADEIYASLLPDNPNLSRATVYRNLNQMSASGEIKKIIIPNAADRFDFQTHDHYHNHCRQCNRVFDSEYPYQPALNKAIHSQDGFEVLDHTVVFSGLCPDCKQKKEGVFHVK